MTEFVLLGQHFVLYPQKALYWKEQKALLIADTHFGKITHFRKSGIAIPDKAAFQNIHRFEYLLNTIKPEQVIILGDLFHSDMNSEWLMFKEFLKKYQSLDFLLIQGNHDILHEITYSNSRFKVFEKPLKLGPFILSHEPMEHSSLYNLCGHLHPGVRMVSSARQTLRFSCFYFGEKGGILPAFGEFTGLYLLKPRKEDAVFIITENEVIEAN